MEFPELVRIVGDDPLFETGLLLAGDVDKAMLQKQLSRWTRAGRIYQLRRGLYALAPPFQRVKPHPFLIANHLARGWYVSCQSALAFYGLIPEYTPITTSVTTGRADEWETPLGIYTCRRIQPRLFWGYRYTAVDSAQKAFVAAPEKALLDLVYLEPGGDTPEYLAGLRLQNMERLKLDDLEQLAGDSGSLKLARAAVEVRNLARTEAEAYETL